MTHTTLSSYMTEVSAEPRYKDLDKVILAIAAGAIDIQAVIRVASLEGAIGDTGVINVQGEAVQVLDTLTSDTFVKVMSQCGHVAAIGCEEIENVVTVGSYSPHSYIVQVDPLDGSSNIDVAISIGSIFGIWKNAAEDAELKMLRPGRAQVAALYTIYGTSTLLVIALENSVQGFTLNPANGKFELSHPDIQLPEKPYCYSIGELVLLQRP